MTTPIFSDEVQFLGWGDGPQGPWIKLKLPDSDDLGPFRGMTQAKATMAGQIMACVLVEVTGTETPKPAEPKPDAPVSLCVLAGQWCRDPRFWDWMWWKLTAKNGPNALGEKCEEKAKEVLCLWLSIKTRKELDTNTQAAARFKEHILEPFRDYLKHGAPK